MKLRPTTSDAVGSVFHGLGFTSAVLSPYLAFGRWSGIETSYIGRLAFFFYGGLAVTLVGTGYRGALYGLNDRLYIVVDPKR